MYSSVLERTYSSAGYVRAKISIFLSHYVNSFIFLFFVVKMKRLLSCFLLLLLQGTIILAYQQPTTVNSSRRDWFVAVTRGAAAAAAASSTSVLLLPGQPSNAVISSKYCAYGTGEGCDDLAEGNEYIRQLQAKSAANKEANISVCTNDSSHYCISFHW